MWDKIEKSAKIASWIAIPVVIAVFGWMVQSRLAEMNVRRDYVKLAVSILTEKDPSQVHPGIRSWSVDLLNENSPVKFSPEILRELKAGEITLPAAFRALVTSATNAGLFAISPDGHVLATVGEKYNVELRDAESGRLIAGFMSGGLRVTSLAFSPDGRTLLTGSLDGMVHLLKVPSGRLLLKFDNSKRIDAVAYSADGSRAFTFTRGQELKEWDVKDWKLVRTFDLRSK